MSEEAPAEALPAAGGDGAFAIDAPAFSSTEFKMYSFKIVRCPRARPHDWTQCPFAHPGEKAKRRDPRKYRYSGTACPDFRKTGICKRADACPFSHGVFECWLHPTRYKTQLCTDGSNCRRRVCFFAHTESELRQPVEHPPLPPSALPADLSAELALQQQQQQQQQQLAAALGGLLGGAPGAQALTGAEAPLRAGRPLELLKGLSLVGRQAGLLDTSGPSTPIGTAVQPPATAGFHDFSHAQAALLQQLQGGAPAACLQSQRNSDVSVQSVLSMRSTGSPNDGEASPGALAGGEPARTSTPPAADAHNQGGTQAAGGTTAEEAEQILRLIQLQQQQQQQQQAAAVAAGGNVGVDPALLFALQGLSLGAGSLGELLEQATPHLQQQQQQQQLADAVAAASEGAGGPQSRRRSLDDSALARQLSGGRQQPLSLLRQPGSLAQAAVPAAAGLPPLPPALAVPGLGKPAVQLTPVGLQLSSLVGEGEVLLAGDPRRASFNRSMSFDHILAELPRSQSEVNLPGFSHFRP